MKLARFLATIAALGLAACEQAQMHGPVGAAVVTVTELRSGNTVISGQLTDDLDTAAGKFAANWDGYNSVQKSWFLGNHTFTEQDRDLFADDTWYVIEMAGGFDYYADGNFFKEPSPVQVFGAVHAIVTGARLKEAVYLVTPVTEAAYQYVKDFAAGLTDDELSDVLDQVAAELVGDVEDDGDLDYNDVLLWNRLFHLAQLKVDIEALTDAVSAGDSSVNDQADSLFDASAPAGVPEKVYGNTISDLIVENGCGPGCHIAPGTATQGPLASDNIILPPTNPEHVTFNTENFRMLVRQEGINHVLTKISGGDGHTGGARLVPGTDGDYETFEAWLKLL